MHRSISMRYQKSCFGAQRLFEFSFVANARSFFSVKRKLLSGMMMSEKNITALVELVEFVVVTRVR